MAPLRPHNDYNYSPKVEFVNVISAGADGPAIVYTVWSVDHVGNYSMVVQDTIGVDRQSPTCAVTLNNGAEWTTDPNVTLDLSDCSDAASGLADVRLSNDSVTWDDWQPLAAAVN